MVLNSRYLNIGCGSRFNRNWINIDIQPSDKVVQAYDILNGLPFDDDYFDAVYHSHVIEHISKQDVDYFLAECFRVLKPNGILRVVAPDLEQIAKLYLQSLYEIDEGNAEWESNHEWMVLEMFDQIVRETSGGEMKQFLQEANEKSQAFIKERWGNEADLIFDAIKNENTSSEKNNIKIEVQDSFGKANSRLRIIASKFSFKQWLVKVLLGSEYEKYQACKVKIDFQNSGELHKWMYDRYSLKKLLLCAGFSNFRVMKASESNIRDWNHQGLDVDERGKVYKPDSFFIEVAKPAA